MKILSIDTSSNLCTVSVLEDSILIKENILCDTRNHSEKILSVIAQTLNEANLNLKDIDLIVCDKGPGSFTGIRIGVATVMSFVDSLKIPCIGISSLESLMYNELLHNSTDSYICPLIDAKNENVYFELYSISDGKPESVISAECKNINNLIEILKDYSNICFVGDGSILYKNLLNSYIKNASFSNNNQISSYSLGIAGLNAYNSGRKGDILPLYLRKSQAERAKEQIN